MFEGEPDGTGPKIDAGGRAGIWSDRPALGAGARKSMWVRVPPPALEPSRLATRDSRLDVMEVTSVRPGYELWRPNREKPEAKTMKAIVSFVLLVSAGLLFII